MLLTENTKLPALTTALMIEAKPSQGSTLATALRAEGSFRFPLPEGEYRITLGKLPGGIRVKSITYGVADLQKEPLILDGSSPPGELRVVLEAP
jgi:hypothetical protein